MPALAASPRPIPIRRRSAVPWVVCGLALFLIAAISATVLLRVLGAASFYNAVTDTETLSPAQIEAVGQFKFPPGAANIRSRYVSWLDYSLHVSFTLPPAELGALLDSTRVQRPLSTTRNPFLLTQPDGWWNPGYPAAFEAGGSSSAPEAMSPGYPDDDSTTAAPILPTTRPDIRQQILIDKTNPQLYKVWLQVTG